METELKTQLGEELYNACRLNQRAKVEELVVQRLAMNPTLQSAVMTAAAAHDAADVIAFALEQGVAVTDPVMVAISANGSFTSHRVLIEAKVVDIDYVIPWHGDILSRAATSNRLDWATFCLQHGANPNLNIVDEYKTVLAAVAELGYKPMAKLLLQHGAWLKGSGAIVLAAEAGQTEMVQFLLEQGADVNELGVEDPTDARLDGEVGTSLHKAIAAGHVETALLLIDAGADLNVKDAQNRTPKHLAEQHQQTEVLERMRS